MADRARAARRLEEQREQELPESLQVDAARLSMDVDERPIELSEQDR